MSAQFLDRLLASKLIRGAGFKIGVTWGDQYVDKQYTNGFDPKKRSYVMTGIPGFNFNVHLEFFEHKKYSILTELGYNLKRSNERYYIMDASGKRTDSSFTTHSLGYLSFGIPLKKRFNFKKYSFYVLLGHRLDILLHDNVATNDSVKLKGLNYGWTIGLGVEIPNIFPFLVFMEYQFNPDFTTSYQTNYVKNNHISSELKLGIRIEPKEEEATTMIH